MIVIQFNRCNNNCKHCMVSKSFEMPYIKWSDIKIKIDMGYYKDHVDFFGGEPTIHPYFFLALQYATLKGYRCDIATNCRMFYYKEFTQKIMQLKPNTIRTTLYDCYAKGHDAITQVDGSFKQTVKGIKNILKYNVSLLVNIIITKRNYTRLKEIAHYILNLGVQEIRLSSLIVEGNLKNNIELLPTYSETSPYISKTLQFLLRRNIKKVLIEKTPICVAPLFFKNFILESDSSVNWSKTYRKPKFCNDCKYEHHCNGIDILYARMFGLSEFTKTFCIQK